MKNLLVTLISDQPAPNIQFIKEKGNVKTDFLFISTKEMEKKGVRKWIMNVCNISKEKTVIVDNAFSLNEIEEKLSNETYDKYENIYVNVTGGTKIMSMGVTDFFKKNGKANIYYLTGQDCWHLFPIEKRWSDRLKDNITLEEYIESYGFRMEKESMSGISPDYTKKFFQKFLNFGEKEWSIIGKLRERRNKKAYSIDEIDGLQSFLNSINFPIIDEIKINKKEIKYLTGDWFEEHIYHSIREEKIISEGNIKTGVHLTKENNKGTKISNEFDVIFLWKTKFYAIECKTSILSGEKDIVNDTIYKSVALQKNLGLFSNFSIMTLSSKDSKEVKEAHLDRANDLGIKVFCREDILGSNSITQLL
ncbi:MAG: DUF1887 family protein [Bacteroidales bacterium]|jgi:hypothetical protein|nr:DUF1887 family protein [Bacteroidales bacterium]